MSDTPTDDLKKGDIVSVIALRQFGPDQHIPARVKVVTAGAIGVQAVRGDFDGQGNDVLWLQKSARGRTWR